MASVLDNTVEDLKPQKKEIEILKVLAEKVRGHVKWYSVARRYGFISRNDDGGDLFVHRSVISSCSRRIPSLRSGEEVEFNVVETNHGVEANYVTGPGGQPVKGIKPVYRRFRTTSEPNMDPNSTHTPAFTPEAEHVRPRQGGRRPRGPRQSSNRVLSAGANESQKNEEGEHADNGKHEQPNGTTPHQLNEHTVVDGHSPNHTVPRQRRRPQRRTPRHRSAPTADTGDNMDDDQNGLEHDAHTPVARYDGRGHPRPFRRPFRQRGGFRYMNGYAYGQNYMVHPVGPPPYQNRFRPMGGYRDGFDQGPRRRGFGGGYPRGPRRRPPAAGDHAPRLNGQVGVDKEQPAESADVVSGESNVTEDAVVVTVAESAQNVVIQSQVVPDSMNTPQEQSPESSESADMVTTTGDALKERTPVTIERPVTEAAVDPNVALDTPSVLHNTVDTESASDAYHPETGSASKDEPEAGPTVKDVIEGVQQIALHDGKLVSTTAADAPDASVKQEAK